MSSARRAGPPFATQVVCAVVVFALAARVSADEYEIGLENFLYRSRSSLINRENVLGLASTENLFRISGSARLVRGEWTVKASGFAERQSGARDKNDGRLRQAYVEYRPGEGFQFRAGRQRIAWGSGFVWNPTARFEAPKSPANPTTEQPGVDAARIDVAPRDGVGLTFVVARAQAEVQDLPGGLTSTVPSRDALGATSMSARWTGAWRARFLLKDTDLAIVFLAGEKRDGLVGFDVGRAFGAIAWHAEMSFYRGAEIDGTRRQDFFARAAVGALWSQGDTSFSAEYFFNGEGYGSAEFNDYRRRLDRNFALSRDPRASNELRLLSAAAYAQDARIPFGENLGLRRHYATLSVTRSEIRPSLSASLRAVSGLQDSGLIVTPSLTYAPGRNLRMNADLILLFGPESAEYKLVPIRRAVQARVRYVF